MYSSRELISVRIRSDTFTSCAGSFSFLKKASASSIDINTISVMDKPPTLTYCASLRSRVPLQSGQSVLPRYRESITRYWILCDFLSRYLKNSFIPSKYSFPVQSNSRSAGVSSLYGRWMGKPNLIPFLIRGVSHSLITSDRQEIGRAHV